MMKRLSFGSLLFLIILPTFAFCGKDNPLNLDAELLQRANLKTDSKSLIQLIKARTGTDEAARKIHQLVTQLGSDRFANRSEATRQLIELGTVALPALQKAIRHPILEPRLRAAQCIDRIQQNSNPAISAAAVRLLLRDRPPGSTEVLIRYLPYAADQYLQEDVWIVLDALAVSRGKVDPAVEPAVHSPFPERRAAAGFFLGRAGNENQKTKARKLLNDQDTLVGLRTAQGLLAGGDKTGIPTLISLLEDPRQSIFWQAEELLRFVAGPAAPDIQLGAGGKKVQKQCRKAWRIWWQQNNNALDLSNLGRNRHMPILVLVCESLSRGGARVNLVGSDGRTRWELAGVGGRIWDAELLQGGRVLIAHGEVSERDLHGKVLWKSGTSFADSCKRLPNGNTFFGIVNGRGFRIIDPEGKTLQQHELQPVGNRSIHHDWPCRWHPSGRAIACFSTKPLLNGKLPFVAEFDLNSGVEVKRVTVKKKMNWPSRAQPLLSGGYLIAGSRTGVLEINASGEIVWQYQSEGAPMAASRLYDGSTLVVHQRNYGHAPTLVRLNTQGKVIWGTNANVVQPSQVMNMRLCFRLVGLGFQRSN